MEKLNSVAKFLKYFREHKQGFICCEPRQKLKTFGEKTQFFFIADIIEPETIVFKIVSVHGKTMFKLSYIDIKYDWIPFNQFEDFEITALSRDEFKKMWILSQLETMNEKGKT